MSQQTKFDSSICQTLTVMAKRVKQLRLEVCEFKERHPAASKTDIVGHFVDAGYSRFGIYNIMALLDNNQSIERKPGFGRPTTLSDKKLQRKLKRMTEGKVATSLRTLGREVGATGQTVKKYLANMDIHIRKRKSRPLVSELQAMTQRQRLNRMVTSIFPSNRDVAVVMDDETYLTLDGNDWQGTSYFTSPTKEVSSEVKFISHTKFPKKVLLWLTISEKGISKPLFFRSGLAVNGDIYSTKCLPEVAKFIKKYHKDEDVVFWPDLASAHYSKRSLEEMERLNIDVVPKSANPLNVLQLHPMENFSANLNRKMYLNKFVAKTEDELVNKTRKNSKTCPHACVCPPRRIFRITAGRPVARA